MNATWLDVGLAVLIGVGAFRGFKRGLVREGMAFAGLAVGLVLASRWQSAVAEVLYPFVGRGRLVDALAYLLVVLAVLVCATLLTAFMRRLMRMLLVGWLDRLGGALVGGAQGALLALLLLFLVVKYSIAGLDGAVGDSELATGLLGVLPTLLAHLPLEMGPVASFFELPEHP